MLSNLLPRIRWPHGAAEIRRRTDVCPPSLLQGNLLAATGWRAGLRDWLSTGWNTASGGLQGRVSGRAGRGGAGESHLCAVRSEFLTALQDIRTQEVALLRHRIGIAHSLRELWHLRPEVFKLVALRFSQTEAQCRLDRLNRYFPTRSPRSGFAPIEG
jgi:hypothetical protein